MFLDNKKDYYIALDIYRYIQKIYYGKDEEDIQFRVHHGSNGAVNKILNYIENKYLTF